MNGLLHNLPAIAALKAKARHLRQEAAARGAAITHSKALERLAIQYGYKDWNTLRAAAVKPRLSFLTELGTRVRGHYLSQPFEGTVIGLHTLPNSPGRFRVTVQFDNPVDVVTFDGLTNLRRRIRCVVDHSGQTRERTSNGRPQLQLEV